MEIGVFSHTGKVREINEDSYYISSNDMNLFIVADGMGGHNAGEIASDIAVHSVVSFMEKRETLNMEENVCEILQESVSEANKKIFLKAKLEQEYQGMGTTLTAVLLLSKLYVAHVGDSRAYLIRDHSISQITRDHSLVGELLREGSITEEEAKVHPQRNMITRALGTDEDVTIDTYTLEIQSNDIIFLCTDGLSNLIEKEEMKSALMDCSNVQKACEHLVALANERGGYDNSTVVAIKNN